MAPQYAEAHNNLGNSFAAQGNLDDAIRHYRQALAIDPAYADAKKNLSFALRAKEEAAR